MNLEAGRNRPPINDVEIRAPVVPRGPGQCRPPQDGKDDLLRAKVLRIQTHTAQIEQGAPADVFISADLDWMKYLTDKKLTRPDTEVKLLGNRIVLVTPADSEASAEIAQGFDLAELVGDGRLAMANVDSVPAGKYGKAALEKLGVWDSVSGKVAQAENVRAALALVSTGEAPLGIVYKTDAAADPKVEVVAAFPADTHPPIVYPVAQTAESKGDNTASFLKCLRTPKAKELFEAQGFTVLAPAATN